MKTITVNKEQARRIGMPELEGRKVYCEMPSKADVKAGCPERAAKNVYFNGERIGGQLALED